MTDSVDPDRVSDPATGTFAYVAAFIEGLVESGLRHVCICPGSRSTPLAMLLAEHPRIRAWSHVDERSAAFFALGMAKVLRQPVGVVCTSGTAAANFHPAIVEARYGRVPVLAVTADRPHELRDWGANQTINQIGLFGDTVKWFVDVSPPATADELPRYITAVARRAVATAVAAPPGPVHLNFPFREPLSPDPRYGPVETRTQRAPAASPTGDILPTQDAINRVSTACSCRGTFGSRP